MTYSKDVNEKIYEELLGIKSLLERLARKELREDLESIASTKERKVMWTFCDGMTRTAEIAAKVGVSQRAVQIFINELAAKDLVTMGKRGYPKRKYDYIPSDWQDKGEEIGQ